MKKYFIYFVLIVIVFASCKSKKAIVCTPVQTVEKHITKLVPVYLPSDSSLLKAYLACDSANQVYLKSISENKSGRMESKLTLHDNVLDYKIKTIRDTVYAKSDTVYIYKEIPVKAVTEKTIYRMTKIQRFLFYIGIIAITATVVWLTFKINIKNLLNRILKLFKQ